MAMTLQKISGMEDTIFILGKDIHWPLCIKEVLFQCLALPYIMTDLKYFPRRDVNSWRVAFAFFIAAILCPVLRILFLLELIHHKLCSYCFVDFVVSWNGGNPGVAQSLARNTSKKAVFFWADHLSARKSDRDSWLVNGVCLTKRERPIHHLSKTPECIVHYVLGCFCGFFGSTSSCFRCKAWSMASS